jgi:hypothetical protein
MTLRQPKVRPSLNIFMRALPYTFRDAGAPIGSTVAVSISGEAGGNWYVERVSTGCQQPPEIHPEANASIVLDQDTAWKLLTKRRRRAAALKPFPDIECHALIRAQLAMATLHRWDGPSINDVFYAGDGARQRRHEKRN